MLDDLLAHISKEYLEGKLDDDQYFNEIKSLLAEVEYPERLSAIARLMSKDLGVDNAG